MEPLNVSGHRRHLRHSGRRKNAMALNVNLEQVHAVFAGAVELNAVTSGGIGADSSRTATSSSSFLSPSGSDQAGIMRLSPLWSPGSLSPVPSLSGQSQSHAPLSTSEHSLLLPSGGRSSRGLGVSGNHQTDIGWATMSPPVTGRRLSVSTESASSTMGGSGSGVRRRSHSVVHHPVNLAAGRRHSDQPSHTYLYSGIGHQSHSHHHHHRGESGARAGGVMDTLLENSEDTEARHRYDKLLLVPAPYESVSGVQNGGDYLSPVLSPTASRPLSASAGPLLLRRSPTPSSTGGGGSPSSLTPPQQSPSLLRTTPPPAAIEWTGPAFPHQQQPSSGVSTGSGGARGAPQRYQSPPQSSADGSLGSYLKMGAQGYSAMAPSVTTSSSTPGSSSMPSSWMGSPGAEWRHALISVDPRLNVEPSLNTGIEILLGQGLWRPISLFQLTPLSVETLLRQLPERVQPAVFHFYNAGRMLSSSVPAPAPAAGAVYSTTASFPQTVPSATDFFAPFANGAAPAPLTAFPFAGAAAASGPSSVSGDGDHHMGIPERGRSRNGRRRKKRTLSPSGMLSSDDDNDPNDEEFTLGGGGSKTRVSGNRRKKGRRKANQHGSSSAVSTTAAAAAAAAATAAGSSADTGSRSNLWPADKPLPSAAATRGVDGRHHCPMCASSFTRPAKLREHMLARHSRAGRQAKPHRCLEVGCGKSFSRADNLKRHFDEVHLGRSRRDQI